MKVTDQEEFANPPSVRLAWKIIKKRVLRNPKRSIRKIARDIYMNCETVRLIAMEDLRFKPYKMRKIQLLMNANKAVKKERCQMLLNRAAGVNWERILFSDEKLFII